MSEKTYVLNGDHPVEGDSQLLFTQNERATAVGIAREWLEKGWKPFLFSKTYDGNFNVLLNYRNHGKKNKVRRKMAA